MSIWSPAPCGWSAPWSELLEAPVKVEKEPKSDAGKRPVAIPPHVLPIVADHVERWARPELLFVGRSGRRLNGATVYQAFVRARTKVWLTLVLS